MRRRGKMRRRRGRKMGGRRRKYEEGEDSNANASFWLSPTLNIFNLKIKNMLGFFSFIIILSSQKS